MRVIGLIPARRGSKGVPGKNIRLLAGKPLLAWTAAAALESRRLSRVLLSTDDSEIAAAGLACGLEVPFLRPAELADDRSPMLPVVQHAIRAIEAAGDTCDAVCLLQPTNPFREARDIDGAIELLASSGADAVVSVRTVPAEFNPHWVYVHGDEGYLQLSTGESAPIPRRQDLPPAFHRDGSVYVTRRDVLINENSLYGRRLLGYAMDGRTVANIDTPADWDRAEALARAAQGVG